MKILPLLMKFHLKLNILKRIYFCSIFQIFKEFLRKKRIEVKKRSLKKKFGFGKMLEKEK